MPVEEPAVAGLAQLIRDAREALAWTQEDLARESGVSRPTIQRYETAKIRSPEPQQLRRIVLALGIDPREVPVALGMVTRDELKLPPQPVLPARRYSRSTEEIIELLEDPSVSDEEKQALASFLMARRRGRSDAPTAAPRRAG
ncbi:helix-turn-helix transcriptional regulator [Micromonospora echinospora]|uniref:helix-turn-helix transcriptional regulator n=1 Tax=Micromonospora echinospora TaxID=1877 RepID=UPI00378B0F1F